MGPNFLKRLFLAAACGLAPAAPALISPPPAWALAGAAAGMGGDHGFLPTVASFLWRAGGAGALSSANFAGLWLAWSAGFLVILVVGGHLASGFPRWVRRAVPLGVILAGGLFGGGGLWAAAKGESLASLYPADLAGRADGEKIFASPSAQVPLLLWGNAPAMPDAAGARAFCASPEKWRSAARSAGWDTVLLTGPSDEIGPLLRHLIASPDWRLAAMDVHGWLFLRDGKSPVPPPDPQKLSAGSPLETARLLARFSDRFFAAGDMRAARASITRALELAPRDPHVQIRAARFYASIKRWHEALKYSDRAIRGGLRNAGAHATKALAALESGDTATARAAAENALARSPNDRYTLFLLAKICRAERDIKSEIATLKKLVAAGGKTPDGPTLAYLGQAYALDGNAEAAADAYRRALQAPNLDAEQQEALKESLANVEKHIR